MNFTIEGSKLFNPFIKCDIFTFEDNSINIKVNDILYSLHDQDQTYKNGIDFEKRKKESIIKRKKKQKSTILNFRLLLMKIKNLMSQN